MTSQVAATSEPRFTWRAHPDLMARLIAAQNSLYTPIDIVSFAGMCDSRDELERHVVRYENEVAIQVEPAKRSRKKR